MRKRIRSLQRRPLQLRLPQQRRQQQAPQQQPAKLAPVSLLLTTPSRRVQSLVSPSELPPWLSLPQFCCTCVADSHGTLPSANSTTAPAPVTEQCSKFHSVPTLTATCQVTWTPRNICPCIVASWAWALALHFLATLLRMILTCPPHCILHIQSVTPCIRDHWHQVATLARPTVHHLAKCSLYRHTAVMHPRACKSSRLVPTQVRQELTKPSRNSTPHHAVAYSSVPPPHIHEMAAPEPIPPQLQAGDGIMGFIRRSSLSKSGGVERYG